jgi:GDP-4-dehydro-6-deoxy-D-mannose reductase
VTPPRLLVTGATGFVGSWTLQHWRQAHPEVEVWATSERPCPPNLEAHEYRQVDLRDPDAVCALVAACRPTQVLHLGGLIGNAPLADHLAVNVVGTERLYAALAETGPPPDLRIVQTSSAATYGPIRPEDLPITERQPPCPITAYALSKTAQDHLAEALWRTRGLWIVRGCVFNLLGPGQPEALVPMTFIRQLHDIRAGRADRLRVGHTASRRDFIDVRDVVAALDALLTHGSPGEAYNIGSGRDVSVQEVIEELFGIAGFSAPLEVRADRVRPSDVSCVRADVTKLTTATGWRPAIPLPASLEAMWRSMADAG